MQNNSKAPADMPKLPAFNQTISIEIEVDAIYQKLMDTFPVDYKHKEILSHAIIGSTFPDGKISYIYNALNGYTNDIDFKVGDRVVCTELERQERYDSSLFNADGSSKNAQMANPDGHKPNWASKRVEIGECEIIAIDLYNNKKLKVRFYSQGRYDNAPELIEYWVSHKRCTTIPLNVEDQPEFLAKVEATREKMSPVAVKG